MAVVSSIHHLIFPQQITSFTFTKVSVQQYLVRTSGNIDRAIACQALEIVYLQVWLCRPEVLDHLNLQSAFSVGDLVDKGDLENSQHLRQRDRPLLHPTHPTSDQLDESYSRYETED